MIQEFNCVAIFLVFVAAPSAPVITNLTYNSSNSIRVEWTRPEIVYKQIDRYMIKYKAQDISFYQETALISVNPSMPHPEVKLLVADISSNVVAVCIFVPPRLAPPCRGPDGDMRYGVGRGS